VADDRDDVLREALRELTMAVRSIAHSHDVNALLITNSVLARLESRGEVKAENATCSCGHSASWHLNDGDGSCCASPESCKCVAFTILATPPPPDASEVSEEELRLCEEANRHQPPGSIYKQLSRFARVALAAREELGKAKDCAAFWRNQADDAVAGRNKAEDDLAAARRERDEANQAAGYWMEQANKRHNDLIRETERERDEASESLKTWQKMHARVCVRLNDTVLERDEAKAEAKRLWKALHTVSNTSKAALSPATEEPRP